MSGVEIGAGLAWRLFATLEGGTLLLVTSALIAYTTRRKLATRKRIYRPIKNVFLTDTTSVLGRQLHARLTERGCSVSTSEYENGKNLDCLVVVGADCKDGLDGLAQLVTDDVHNNLRSLESMSSHVVAGGTIVWSWCVRSGGPYRSAAAAFRVVMKTALMHFAELSDCEAVWLEGYDTAEQTADKIMGELFPCDARDRFSFSSDCEAVWLEGYDTAERTADKIMEELFPCDARHGFSFRYCDTRHLTPASAVCSVLTSLIVITDVGPL
ncbi:hypothetical protein KGM_215722 [Danaus plexippus plexippus]|uniref:Uncharacterized protein n=1 Tax=Danaus plexippus plexippus TaxID=278856 RepID=A0A212EKU7_DANPL|nr:hypothetical protein KGM_215722 [Danaus plexippus plexippus]